MRVSQLRSRRAPRRGSVYIAVLGVAAIVSAIGMSAMMVARLKLRQVTVGQELDQARLLADSAIEMGASIVFQDSNWRTTYQNATEYPLMPMPMGKGTITWKLVDDDGNLDDDNTDAVRLHGIGRVGKRVYVSSVLLEPAGGALDCLSSALHAHGKLWLNTVGAAITATGAPISSNNQLKNWATVNGDLQHVGGTNLGTINGTVTNPLSPLKKLPNATHIFEYYLNNGKWIDVDDIPGTAPNLIEKVVLSPGNNPFGDNVTNPQGIYVIDCKNQNIRVKLVRLVGTLVLLNAGSGSDLDNDQHWEPAVPNFPVLLVDGNITFNWHGEHNLRESHAAVNYNPAHTPYEEQSDTDQTDEYPPLIKGLIYVSGNLDVTHECVLEGVTVMGGYLNMFSDITLTYDPVYLNNPPPGFRGSDVKSPEQQWLDQNTSNSGSGSNYTFGTGKGVGTYFAPMLPAEATSWSITRVQIYANDANSTGTFNAQITAADGSQMPASVIQSVQVQETDLPGTFNWHEITFSGASGFQPTAGACVVFVSGSNAGSRIKCGTGSTGSPGTHRLITADGGGSWAAETSNDLWIKVWGTYTTASGSVIELSPGSWQREPGI